jgi:hypothetical protein
MEVPSSAQPDHTNRNVEAQPHSTGRRKKLLSNLYKARVRGSLIGALLIVREFPADAQRYAPFRPA